ncbi:helix-turn-helix domain-containing protein [Methylobacter luteus]|uniref:helix-turn-helix domain-containing protein n=1 Tax=Methylobacter luteus TaxID=415 RepID=UPI0003F682BE|nr:helix-turn-helix transcriptional regulator [Methylobacter luteus]
MMDKDEIAITKIVGSRMVEAREICKLPRHVAADRLDVSDSLLAKIESGVDIETIPLKLVRLASLIYDVSVDFLLGFSSDFEVAEETKLGREIGAWVHHQQAKLFTQWAARQMALEGQVEAMAAAVGVLLAEIEAINEALTAFKRLNSDFNRLPAGSQLQYRIRKAHESAQTARRALIRHKVQACK